MWQQTNLGLGLQGSFGYTTPGGSTSQGFGLMQGMMGNVAGGQASNLGYQGLGTGLLASGAGLMGSTTGNYSHGEVSRQLPMRSSTYTGISGVQGQQGLPLGVQGRQGLALGVQDQQGPQGLALGVQDQQGPQGLALEVHGRQGLALGVQGQQRLALGVQSQQGLALGVQDQQSLFPQPTSSYDEWEESKSSHDFSRARYYGDPDDMRERRRQSRSPSPVTSRGRSRGEERFDKHTGYREESPDESTTSRMRRILLSAGIESEGDLRRLVEVAKRNNPSIRDQHSSSREESPEDETSKRMRSVAESVGVRDERDLRDLVQAALANQRGPASSGKRPSQQGSSSSSTEKRRKMTPSSADAKSSTTSSTGLLRGTDSRKEDTPYTMQLSNREKRRKEAPSPAGTRASITGSAGLLGDRASITGSAGLLGDRASITGSAGLLGDRASITGSAGLLGDRASITGSAGLLGDRASITGSAGLLGDRAFITGSAGLLGDRDTRNEDTPYTRQPSPAWPAGSSLPQGKVQPLLSPDVIEVARIRKRKMELLAEQARLEEEERQLMQLKDGRMDNKNTMKPTEGGNGRQLDLLESRREEARRKLLEIESKDRPRPAREDDRGRESRGRSRDIGTPQEKKREDKDRRSSGQRKRSRFDSPLRDVKNETRTHSRERERYMDERGRSQRDLNPRKLDKSNLPQEGSPTREYRSGRMERERARHIDEQGRSQRNLNLQKLDERDLSQAGSSTREYGSEREQLGRDIHQQGRSRLQEEPAERWRERYSPGLQDKDRMEHLRTGLDADSGRDPQLGDSQVEGKYISPEEEEKNRKLELQKEAKKRLQAYARTAQQKLEGQKRMEQKRKEIKQLQKEWARQHAEATKKAEKKLQMEYTEFLSSLDTSEGKKEEVEEESHVTAEELELAKMTAQQFGISDVPLALEALKLMKELDASGYEDLVEFGDLLGRLARGELEVMDIADILPPRVAELITSGKLKPQLIDTLVQISKQTAADNGVEDSDRGKEEQRTRAQRGGSWQGKTSRASSRSEEGGGSSLPPETKALDKHKLFVHKIPKGTTHYQLLRLFPRATRIDYPKTRSAAFFAFAFFDSVVDAAQAMRDTNGKLFNGSVLQVKYGIQSVEKERASKHSVTSDMIRPREITLTRGPGQMFGFSIQKGTCPVSVACVEMGSVAQAAGVKEGDVLLEVGLRDVTSCSHEQVTSLIQAAGDSLFLTVVAAAYTG